MANTRAQQTTLISANIPDNNEKLVTPAKVREVDNAGVSACAFVDDDNDFTGIQTHAKEVRWHKGPNLASASTLALGATGNYHHVTGTTTITGLSTKQHGTRMLLRFNGALILTHSSALLLPTAANITTAAGDIAEFVSEGSGNWRCASYLRADGTALVGASLPSAVQYNTYEKGASVVEAVMPWFVVRTGEPADSNDETEGFRAGTIWKNLVTGIEYICTDDEEDAAVWVAQSGTWVPTLTLSGFDSASNIASQYQIVGNYCLFQCRVEGGNSGLVSTGFIDIEPPLGLTAGVTVATVSLRNIGVVALFSDILVEQASGLIQITAEFATPTIGAYEFVISGSFLIA